MSGSARPNTRLKLAGLSFSKESECCALARTNYRSAAQRSVGESPAAEARSVRRRSVLRRVVLKLRTSTGAELENPTAQDIEGALVDLPVNAEYEAVLAKGEDAFIQARGEVSEEWAGGAADGLMLHALDGARHMFESLKRHPPATVIRLFTLYAQGNPQWKQEIEWREYTSAGRSLLVIGGIIVLVFLVWRLIH